MHPNIESPPIKLDGTVSTILFGVLFVVMLGRAPLIVRACAHSARSLFLLVVCCVCRCYVLLYARARTANAFFFVVLVVRDCHGLASIESLADHRVHPEHRDISLSLGRQPPTS